MIEILSALSASAATGIRIALPLLCIGILHGHDLWSQVPVLSRIYPPFLLFLLIAWSVVEIFASKKLTGQRILQVIQLVLSPVVGAIAGITCAHAAEIPLWIVAIIGGTISLVLQLVQVGWFFRLRGLPVWVACIQDGLCVALVLLAFDAPCQGGLIALLLLWMAVRSSRYWYNWYKKGKIPAQKYLRIQL